jgi:HK97 family phage major capsid protein
MKTAALLAASALTALDNPVMPGGLRLRKEPTVADVMSAFEEFKAANDTRLDEIEKRGAADVLVEEKTKKINEAITGLQDTLNKRAADREADQKRIDELEAQLKRAGAPNADKQESAEQRQYRADFLTFVRHGKDPESLQKRAMSVGDNTQGGYLAPETVDQEIARVARQVSSVRQIARVVSINGPVWKKRISLSNNSSGWVGEQDSRPQTDPSDLREVTVQAMELYANVYATQSILDDANLNLEAWIAEETNLEFERAEGAALATGDGQNKPQGIVPAAAYITYETYGDMSTAAAQGKVGALKTGSTSALQSADTEAADRIIKLQAQLKPQYRQNARTICNRFVEAAARMIKDENSQYIWQPGMQAGAPNTLLGYPITNLDDMASFADGNVVMMFGDFRQFYTVVDRYGVRILRDPYTNKPYVLFYVTKRVGGGRVLTEAAKALVSAT